MASMTPEPEVMLLKANNRKMLEIHFPILTMICTLFMTEMEEE